MQLAHVCYAQTGKPRRRAVRTFPAAHCTAALHDNTIIWDALIVIEGPTAQEVSRSTPAPPVIILMWAPQAARTASPASIQPSRELQAAQIVHQDSFLAQANQTAPSVRQASFQSLQVLRAAHVVMQDSTIPEHVSSTHVQVALAAKQLRHAHRVFPAARSFPALLGNTTMGDVIRALQGSFQ